MIEVPRAERLIVALDLPTAAEARALVEKLGDAARFYKVGLELFSAPGCFELIAWLAARGNKVFADFKLYDIPETVRRAVANLRGGGPPSDGTTPPLGAAGAAQEKGERRSSRHRASRASTARPRRDGREKRPNTSGAGARRGRDRIRRLICSFSRAARSSPIQARCWS